MKTNLQTKKLGDVVEVVNGGTPETNVPKYWNGNILWITPKDMGKLEDIYVENTDRMLSEAGLNESSAKIIPPNSIILSTRAPIGHLAINKKEITTNQGCKGLVPLKNLETKYLFYFLENSLDLLDSLGSGTTFKELSSTKLKDIEIPLPELDEQKRIVKKLDEVFEKVKKAKGAAEKNLQNSKELFESYLQSVFANPGKDWEEKKLKEIGVTQTGLTPKTANKKYYGNFVPFITPADIGISGDGSIRYDSKGLSKEGLEVGRKIDKNSVLMVCIGATIGKVGFSTREISCNQQINTLTPFDKYDGKIFYYILNTKSFFNKVINSSSQATLPIINKGKWENLTITFPKTLAEQKTIVKKLDALSGETRKLEGIYRQKLADLEELKKSVLQKAFKGEL